ncbi:hypothetical protein ACTFIY_009519 [Dictyostelium cf. discoideum]
MSIHLIKKSTGITGLKVEPNARHILAGLYTQLLKKLEILPPTAGYRKSTELETKFRLGVIENETDIVKIENKIYAGQIEELIVQAKNDLKVVDLVNESRAWELPDKNKPPVVIYSSK